eukprot:273175_1
MDIDSEAFLLDPEFNDDPFWDAVSAIESRSKKCKSSSSIYYKEHTPNIKISKFKTAPRKPLSFKKLKRTDSDTNTNSSHQHSKYQSSYSNRSHNINLSNMSNINNNNTFAIPKKSLKHIQTDKEKKAITDLINVKREMAKLRQKNRKNEEQLLAEVETYKRRSNDLQNESRKYQCKFKELQNENYEKYTKQFRSLRAQLTEVECQRNKKK